MKINLNIIVQSYLFLILFGNLNAQSIVSNRTALNALIGDSRLDEGFEEYEQSGATVGEGQLSATNDWGGLASPIGSGVTFRSTYPSSTPEEFWIQWNGNGFDGGITKTIYSSGSLYMDFWNPTAAFGIDIKDSAVFRETFIAGVTVYGADDTTVLYSNSAINLTDPAVGVFFGYEFGGGIGAVEFFTVSGANPYGHSPGIFSPKIDNLSFSTTPIPEPSTLAIALVGLGALTWRLRKK